MNIRSVTVLGLMLGLSLAPVARANPLESAQTEISYLLSYIESSGCDFYRNGSWYDAKRAQAHLREKYDYLVARHRVETAEDFIEKAATQSSLTGQPYQVRCSGAQAVTSNQWLHGVLALFRSSLPVSRNAKTS